MIFTYNKTSIGYAHQKSNKVCQDYSDTYIDPDIVIVTACDGHGGEVYIRSDVGSKLASKAVIDVFQNVDKSKLKELIQSNNLDKLKLEIICKWNEYVEQDYLDNSFKDEELTNLSEQQINLLLNNFFNAYGTTINASILFDEYVICIQIGDGGIFLLKDDKMEVAVIENDETVANLTYSMCGDDAYNHLYINAFERKNYDGVIICTDGVLSPYQSYFNFHQHFVSPITRNLKVINQKTIDDLDAFINLLGQEIGVGDDVSLGIIYYN